MSQEPDVVVVVRCERCKSEREIRAGQVPEGGFPMCGKCYMPMMPKEAKRT